MWESRQERIQHEHTRAPNRLRWLGNGLSDALLPGGDPSWYLNEDAVEVPHEGLQEDDPRYKARPFSH